MKKFLWSLFILGGVFAAVYVLRPFILETFLKKVTGESLAYESRTWQNGKLVYRHLSLGDQISIEQAEFVFSLTPKVHLIEPVIQLGGSEPSINPAFLLKIDLEIEDGALVSLDGDVYPFDFSNRTLSLDQLLTCQIHEDGAYDIQMEEASLKKILPLASLLAPIPTAKVIEGTASGSITAGGSDLRGNLSFKNLRWESDNLIFALDTADCQINYQGELETLSLNSDFKGADLFWKELEIVQGEGSLVFEPQKSPTFELHAAVNVGLLEGRADIIGQGAIDADDNLNLQGAFDYVTAGNMRMKGDLIATFDHWKPLRLQTKNLLVDHLIFDSIVVEKIEAEGIYHLQTGDLEHLALQAHDAIAAYRDWKATDIHATILVKNSQIQTSSAFGKFQGVPFGLELHGPLDTFHANVILVATASEWLHHLKSPEEPSIVLDVAIDRLQDDFQLQGSLSCLEDVVQLQAQGNLAGDWKGTFETSRLQSISYLPFLKIWAPGVQMQGELAARGTFSPESIDVALQSQDLALKASELELSIPGRSREMTYHYDLKHQLGSGKGRISPLTLLTLGSISLTDGEWILDGSSLSCHQCTGEIGGISVEADWTVTWKDRLEAVFQNIEADLTPQLRLQNGRCNMVYDHRLVLQNIQGTLSSPLQEQIAFSSPEMMRDQENWTFSVAFSHAAAEILSLRGEARELSPGFTIILNEGKASKSYLKSPLSFQWIPSRPIEQVKGSVFVELASLPEQLFLLDQFGLYTMNHRVKELLDPLQGNMTLKFVEEGVEIQATTSLCPSIQGRLDQNGSFDVEAQIDSRFSIATSGRFINQEFQNLALKLFDEKTTLATLSCDTLAYLAEKWESPAVQLAVYSKYLTHPLKAKLLLSISPQSTTFQGSATEGDVVMGKSHLKIQHLYGLYEAPFLNLKCTASLDGEPLYVIGKFSKDHKFGGGLHIQKGSEVFKISLSAPTQFQSLQGEFLGLACDILREGEGYKGTLSIKDSAQLANLTGNDHLRDLSELRFTGKYDQGTFKGTLEGKEACIKNTLVEQLQAQVEFAPHQFRLKNLTVQDPAGSLTIKECTGTYSNNAWRLQIPYLKGQEIKPSLLRKKGIPLKEEKPFQIRHLVMTDIDGKLGQLTSFIGQGSMYFTQRIKKEPSFFDIPLTLLKDFGLTLDLFTPVMGEATLQLKEGKFVFNTLQNAFSEGQRSVFYLDPDTSSYIDLNGPLFLNLRMTQNVVLKLAEPFTIAVRGTWDKPKYSLR